MSVMRDICDREAKRLVREGEEATWGRIRHEARCIAREEVYDHEQESHSDRYGTEILELRNRLDCRNAQLEVQDRKIEKMTEDLIELQRRNGKLDEEVSIMRGATFKDKWEHCEKELEKASLEAKSMEAKIAGERARGDDHFRLSQAYRCQMNNAIEILGGTIF